MAEIPEPFRAPLVFELPGMESVPVQSDLVYRTLQDRVLHMDVYHPPGPRLAARRPAVLFVHGDAPPEILTHAKDWGAYRGWGQLAALSGLVGITFNHRSSEGRTRLSEACTDVAAAIEYVRTNAEQLGVDPDRLCFWVCSAGGFKLKLALAANQSYIRCIVGYYPVLEWNEAEFSAIHFVSPQAAPMLLARAGLDNPVLNAGIDRFVQEALAKNMTLDLYNHPTGNHAFDIRNPGPRSSEIIAQTLAFMVRHLN